MFESIIKFLKRRNKEEKDGATNSKDAAKERLHLVLMQDRANVSADFLELMKQSSPVGKKIDFLIQEINREVNTIGSKANCLEITNRVIEIKTEVENIREQIQNIE